MHHATLLTAARAVIALALVAAALRTSHRAARALLRGGAGTLAAALTLLATTLSVGTQVALGVGVFSWLASAAILALLGVAARALPPSELAPPSLGGAARVGLALALVAALWRWLRASVSPALAPDSMTYHLYRAARWVQLGHDAPEDWPDAAGYYEFFPTGAEQLWAHGLALVGDDLVVASVGLATLAAAAIAARELARAWGAPEERAALAACAVVTLPAVLTTAFTGYSDVWTLATFLLAAAHARRALDAPAHGGLALLAASMHLAAKPSSALPAALLGAAGLWAAMRDKSLQRKHIALASLVALLVVAPTLLRSALTRGSPLYPLSLGAALPGNPQLAALLAGRLSPQAAEPSPAELVRAFTVGLANMDVDPPGWGVAWLAAVPLALRSLWRARCAARGVGALTLLAASITLVALFGDATRELRTGFLPFSPRLFLALPATLVALAAPFEHRRAASAFVGLVALNLLFAWPRALAPAVSSAVIASLPFVLGGAVVCAAVFRGAPRRLWSQRDLNVPNCGVETRAMQGVIAKASSMDSERSRRCSATRIGGASGTLILRRLLWSVGALVGVGLALVGVGAARGRHRREILRSMGAPPGRRAYEVNPVGGAMTVLWRAGDALERDCARKTSVAFGWSPPGHRIFRYPLMGPSRRNALVYTPVTRGGEVIDLAAEPLLAPRVDPARWYARLRAAGVDHVVTAPPHPRELQWMLSRPTLFEPIAPEAAPLGVFRVRAAHRCPR